MYAEKLQNSRFLSFLFFLTGDAVMRDPKRMIAVMNVEGTIMSVSATLEAAKRMTDERATTGTN